MIISVHDLQRADYHVEPATGQATLDSLPAGAEDVPLTAPIEMKATIYVSEDELVADISATTTAEVTCSRCLNAVPQPLSVRFTEVLQHEAARPASDDEDNSDRHVTYYSGDEIDLLPLVVENLVLALPMKPLCRTECPGLCPTCGQNLNEAECDCETGETDPRLAVLGKLWDKARSERKGVE